MSDEPKKPRSRARIGWGAALLFVLYVLSVGPVWWVIRNDESGTFVEAYRAMYAPIYWVGRHCKPLNRVIYRYDNLFIE
jgi:hypothetical protein